MTLQQMRIRLGVPTHRDVTEIALEGMDPFLRHIYKQVPLGGVLNVENIQERTRLEYWVIMEQVTHPFFMWRNNAQLRYEGSPEPTTTLAWGVDSPVYRCCFQGLDDRYLAWDHPL